LSIIQKRPICCTLQLMSLFALQDGFPPNIYTFSPYTARNTSHLRYRAQPVTAVWGNSRCLLWEPYGTHRYTVWAVHTSQETHRVSATEPNRLMLCGETVAVCCENRTEHRDTLWAVRASQETHHVSATEPNRLMLCGETVAVCYGNHLESIGTFCGQKAGLYNFEAGGTYQWTGKG
jgi:hypothetical protein